MKRILGESNSVLLIVSQDRRLLHICGNGEKIFKALDGDFDTEVSQMVVPSLQVPLNIALHRVKKEKKSVLYTGIKIEDGDEFYNINLKVIPPESEQETGNFNLVQIDYCSVSQSHESPQPEQFKLDNEAQRRFFELEQELQETRENLQALIEELETTNEELTAANEELTASNEELHSVNEELHTVNSEYQTKIQELTELNNDIDNLLKSTNIGVVFLDSELRIRKFTPAATEAIALRQTDTDRPLEELSYKINCPDLLELLRSVLENKQPIEKEVKLKKRDFYFLMRINPYQTEGGQDRGIVISFVKINEIKKVQQQLEETLVELENRKGEINRFFHLSLHMLCIAGLDGYFKQINFSFTRILGYSSQELLTRPFIDFVHPDDVEATVQEVQRLAEGHNTIGFENRYLCKDGSYRWLKWMATVHQEVIYAIAHDLTEQKLAQELQHRQLAAIETASEGIAILNDDKFIYLNQAHIEIFGYSKPEELIGQSWRILYEPEQLAQFEREVFPILLEQGQWQGITKAKHRDGHTFDEELTLTFASTGDLICVCRDITQRLQAESELRSRETELSQLNRKLEQRVAKRTASLANFSDQLKQIHRLTTTDYQQLEDLFADYIETGCKIFNLSTGIVSHVSNHTYTILAVRSPLDLSVGFEVDYQDTYCAEVIAKQTTICFSHVGMMENMKQHPVYQNLRLESFISTPIFVNDTIYGTLNFSDTIPRPRGFESYEREIIELMAKDIGQSLAAWQSKTALQKSEKRFRSAFEQAAVGVAHVAPDGTWLRVNQKLCQIVGYSEEQLLQKTFQDITHPEDLDSDLEYVRQMLAGEIQTYSMEKRYIRQDSSIVWINLTVSLVRKDSGEPDYFISVVEDINDRKKTELALEESKQKLEQANLAKDSFIAHISHELRTPLNSIIGFSDILQQDSNLIEEQLRNVRIISQSGQHLLTLINDILDFSKIEAGKLHIETHDFNLIDFVRGLVDIFRLRAEQKGLNFISQISASLPITVQADETRLRQILLNLLSNAVKFTETGSITFTVVCVADCLESRRQKIRFQVEDTGTGIPEDKLADIFTPFQQLDTHLHNQEGTGLGLTIANNLLQLMDSNIQLSSTPGEGSKFWFDLELIEVDNSNSSTPIDFNFKVRSTRRLKQPCKVLIVDDNADNRYLLVSYLKPLGFITEEAENGAVGLTKAEIFQPDIILLDLMMPVMNGREMAENIRQHDRLSDVVIFAISANSKSITSYEPLDCNAFISKPVNLEHLLELLETHLQLEWIAPKNIADRNNLSNFVTPPKNELIQLLELTDLGDVEAIEQKIKLLEDLDSQYTTFAQKVRYFTSSFQLHKLEKAISELLENNNNL